MTSNTQHTAITSAITLKAKKSMLTNNFLLYAQTT